MDLYEAAKVERLFHDDFFETAYHSPITGELEFLIARILYHYSKNKRLGWRVLLRRQEKKTAPDVRIVVDDQTIAIVEVKAKVGWLQAFFSRERFNKDVARLDAGLSDFDPAVLVEKAGKQLKKYYETFDLEPSDIFLLLPTLALVHRKKSLVTLPQYLEYFSETSKLPKQNLILLSGNIDLDLSYRLGDLKPTHNFERVLQLLHRRTSKLERQTSDEHKQKKEGSEGREGGRLTAASLSNRTRRAEVEVGIASENEDRRQAVHHGGFRIERRGVLLLHRLRFYSL